MVFHAAAAVCHLPLWPAFHVAAVVYHLSP
jgi:hypothetical protein